MTELRDNIFAIEVPEDTFEYEVTFGGDKICCWSSEGHYDIELPEGKWEIICKADSVSEEQAEMVSPGKWSKYFENAPGPLFMDYSDNIYRFDNAIQSLQSLLKSKGLTAGNYLIIKKMS